MTKCLKSWGSRSGLLFIHNMYIQFTDARVTSAKNNVFFFSTEKKKQNLITFF